MVRSASRRLRGILVCTVREPGTWFCGRRNCAGGAIVLRLCDRDRGLYGRGTEVVTEGGKGGWWDLRCESLAWGEGMIVVWRK